MTESPNSSKSGWKRVQEAIDFGGTFYDTNADFDAACDHVWRLLADATAIYDVGSYGTAAFLAVTAIEEIAKAHVGLYRRQNPKPPKGRDPFRDHAAKHAMAVLDTVFMGERLAKAIGTDACERLRDEAVEGFTKTREDGLYAGRKDGKFVTPKNAVGKARSRELLLLAIEAADDALSGYTNRSMEIGKQFEVLFEIVATR